jgi:hypothetical protein
MEIFDCQGSIEIPKDLIGAKLADRPFSGHCLRVLHQELSNLQFARIRRGISHFALAGKG